jgi:glycosyltransferase involved in cell wall biosynthesis
VRILHIINNFDIPSGGAQRIIVELCRRLPQSQFFQMVAHFTGEGTAIEYIPEYCSVFKVNGFYGGVLPDFSSISSLLAEQNPDIVHVHSPSTGLVARGPARLAGKKIVTTAHAVVVSPMGRIGDAITLRYSNAIVGVSRVATEAVRRRNKFFVGARSIFSTIENGVDLSQFSRGEPETLAGNRQKYGLSESDFVIGFVGRMHHHKGYDIALDVATHLGKIIPNYKMLMIGPSSNPQKISAEIERRDLIDRVLYPGSSLNLESIYPIFDLCVFPSRYEGFGLAALEAMAMGCPVVASNIPAFQEVIGTAGVLVKPEGLAMAQTIAELAGQPEKLRVLSDRGRERVNFYDVRKMAERYAVLYNDLV